MILVGSLFRISFQLVLRQHFFDGDTKFDKKNMYFWKTKPRNTWKLGPIWRRGGVVTSLKTYFFHFKPN